MIRNMRQRFARFLKWSDDHMNPIVVKELRQGVQSRVIAAIINVLLIVLVFTCVGGAMLSVDHAGDVTGGREMFLTLQSALFIATIGLIPLYILFRLWKERNAANVDLLFVTTLKPVKIVKGKFYAGLTLVTLLYSVCLPFLLFTYLLRGFDIPSMFLSLLVGYVAAAGVIMLALAIASWASTRPILGSLAIILALPCLCYAIGGVISLTYGMVAFGVGAMLSKGFLAGLAYSLIVFYFLMKIVESMAVGMLSPPSSNRTRRLRVWTSIAILASGGMLAALTRFWPGSIHFMHFTWALVTTHLALILLVIAICERDGYSSRVLVRRPRNMLLRVLAFPYTGGVTGGLVWAAIHLPLIAGMCLLMMELTPFAPHPLHGFEVAALYTWVVYVITYAMLGRFILRLFPKKFSPADGWVFMLLTSSAFMLGSISICFMMDPRFWDRNAIWWYFNPVAAVDNYEVRDGWVLTFFAAAAIAINLVWEFRNIREWFTGDAAARVRASDWNPGEVVPEYDETAEPMEA